MQGSSRRSIGVRVLVLLAGIAAAVCLAEIALRVVGFRPALSSEWMLDNEHRLLDDDIITIERRYLSDAYYEPFKTHPPTKLIVALGDSFTFGIPVAEMDAYPSVLERTLQASGSDVKVMNAGMGDSGPDQELELFVKYVLPRVHPDVVIWQFYPNDSLDNTLKALYSVAHGTELVRLDARDNWMYRRQKFYRATPLPSVVKQRSYLFNLLLRRYERERTAVVPEGWDPTAWGRQKIPLEIERMNDLARKHGFALYLALVAPQSVYREVEKGSAAYNESIEYQKLLGLLEAQPNFIHLDLTKKPVAGENDPATMFADDGRDANPFGTRHFNESGYAAIARLVADRVAHDQEFPRAVVAPPVHLAFGQTAARKWMRAGWYQDEAAGSETYVWSEGQQSVLSLPLPAGGDVRLRFECQPLHFPGNPVQTIAIVLNGQPVQTVTLKPETSRYAVTLPATAVRDGMNTLEFHYGYAKALKDVDPKSQDTRVLAVAWHSMDFIAGAEP